MISPQVQTNLRDIVGLLSGTRRVRTLSIGHIVLCPRITPFTCRNPLDDTSTGTHIINIEPAEMSLCTDCIKGVTHEGTPQGKWEKIGGVDTYISTPIGDYSKNKAILLLTDAFGPQHINSQLLVDDFAANGFKTYAPDYLNRDPVPISFLNSPDNFDIIAWASRHTRDVTNPILKQVIDALKEEGITTFGATGYCFGGRPVFDLGIENIIKVGVVSHPLIDIPADLEKYFSVSKAPLLINSCTFDPQFPLEASAKADEIFGNERFTPGYKREYFEGCVHGFAVRGDMSDERVKAGKEGAFRAAAEWFIHRL